MSTSYILLLVYLGVGRPAVEQIEFRSKEACYAAHATIISDYQQRKHHAVPTVALCLSKG